MNVGVGGKKEEECVLGTVEHTHMARHTLSHVRTILYRTWLLNCVAASRG